MRIFTIAALVLVSSYVAPAVAYAQACSNPGAVCSTGSGTGVCDYDESGNLFCFVSGSSGTSGNSTGTNVPGSSGQSGNSGSNITLLNPLQGGASLESFLNSILDFVIRIGTIIVILMMVYVGYLFVAARGNAGKLEEARRALLWTIIGALILLGAKAIAIGIKATVDALSVGR